ncbi:hypothetical protein ACQ4M3_42245 [Leptolyngbya sp. AN03gr2]|uniref:hypothetical protein n=1 Tax=unclassified Leptolyngbya TaxID=2650499 RepID=UPI003D3185E8
MPRKSASQRTKEANIYLSEERGIKVKLTLIGNRLYIRKTLSLGSTGHKKKQYTLCLSLDADVDGIEQAKADAMYLNQLLAQRGFTWEKWRAYLKQTSSDRKLLQESIAQSVARFHQHFLT